MSTQTYNPWFVEELSEFQFFCCPECDERTQIEKIFLEHALNEHPNAEMGLKKFQIKVEEFDESFVFSQNELNNENGSYIQPGT